MVDPKSGKDSCSYSLDANGYGNLFDIVRGADYTQNKDAESIYCDHYNHHSMSFLALYPDMFSNDEERKQWEEAAKKNGKFDSVWVPEVEFFNSCVQNVPDCKDDGKVEKLKVNAKATATAKSANNTQ